MTEPAGAEGRAAAPDRAPGSVAGELAALLVCENTVARLPPRLRRLWLTLALAVVLGLGALGYAARPSVHVEPGAPAPPLSRARS